MGLDNVKQVPGQENLLRLFSLFPKKRGRLDDSFCSQDTRSTAL